MDAVGIDNSGILSMHCGRETSQHEAAHSGVSDFVESRRAG